jgi:predicted TIM-barrel fold metal-dependent hydrolase
MSEPDIPRFEPAPRAPERRAPVGAVDCHMHVFGPTERYPWSPARGYTPPEALLEDYAVVQERLGLERVVVVQPSVYGTDNRCTHDAVVRLGPKGRGVAVLAPEVGEAELTRLHSAGFRGTRLNLISSGGVSFDAVEVLAGKIAAHGWHLQFFMGHEVLLEHTARLAALPVDLVFDHFGPIDVAKGPDQPAMRAMLDLIASGRSWVKISGAYRVDQGAAPWPAARPFAELLLEEAPERLLWGTDWPHPGPAGPMPNDGDLLDALWDWCRDEGVYQRILLDNPSRLYGFA